MDRESYDRGQDPVFHERPHLLSNKGYRGFITLPTRKSALYESVAAKDQQKG